MNRNHVLTKTGHVRIIEKQWTCCRIVHVACLPIPRTIHKTVHCLFNCSKRELLIFFFRFWINFRLVRLNSTIFFHFQFARHQLTQTVKYILWILFVYSHHPKRTTRKIHPSHGTRILLRLNTISTKLCRGTRHWCCCVEQNVYSMAVRYIYLRLISTHKLIYAGNPYIRTLGSNVMETISLTCWQLNHFIFAHDKCTKIYRLMYKHIRTCLTAFMSVFCKASLYVWIRQQ